MPKTFSGSIEFPSNFNVQGTYPLDDRLVVDSIADLTNGTIESPYQGMVVCIKGTSELWILKTQGVDASHNINNWGKVTGSGGSGGTVSGLSKYSIPMMTPQMLDDAIVDPDVDFDESEDPYVLLDYDAESLVGETTTNTITSVNGTYLDIMMRAIRSLQAEVARLKNSFEYGIDSYKDTKTAKSVLLGEYDNISTDEPLWAIDPGYLSLVTDSNVFNTYLDQNHSFVRLGDGTIDVSVEGQLTFNNCKGKFSDGDSEGNNLTLYNLKDSKLITYLITDKPTITMNLISMDNKTLKKEVNFEPLLKGNTVNKYGFCIVISRKVEDSKTGTKKGFNYIYFSILNYETDKKLYEGYLTSDGELSSTKVGVGERYTIESLVFDKLTLSRMKFYTKFEDFSDEVISSAPSESDYKYEVAHITIRSVENAVMLESIKDQLKDNELIWNKGTKTLHIKSNDKICLIGSNNKEDDNKDTNMTNKQIIEALEKMGLIINVEYEGDTDVIKSVTNMSLAPISDFTFVNGDTGKKFTFTVDNEGNLVGKDKSIETIDEFMARIGDNAGDYDESNYISVRGFICDYLNRIGGNYDKPKGVNVTSDAGKKSDRLRFSSFYAPITTDTAHGCTHSFVELENTSNVDIPLDGIYLHFYNPAAEKVYHLELDGAIKAGGTYLIRGAKHAEFEDESAFIKVKTFDKEWYDNGKLLSFEQVPVKTTEDGKDIASDSPIKCAYRFCLTYGLPNLKETDKLVDRSTADLVIGNTTYKASDYPNKIINPRFIDSCSYSTFASVSSQTGEINPETGKGNPWYANGDTAGIGITITANSMFRLTFALDPAKQAYNGFNAKDSSRIRYNKASDIQILNLDTEFIGYPKSNETIKIDRYTPKASFENRNVMTDKSQLDSEKPNMVTCSFGVDVYNTRCFNWISCGTFDEYIWLRKQGETTWTKFQSYKKVSSVIAEGTTGIHRKEYSKLVNNAVYARMINRFPGNNVLFTSHKCVVVLPDVTNPTIYEYVVGRPDKDGNPDVNHTNEKYTFTLYPRTYEGRVYQITDQQGFNWIEYQVWSASAEFLNTEIATECSSINAKESGTKVFPILINTGDMTQSGARINEWLDYYNGGKSLFNHLEQMNCVGNNDLNPVSPNDLGTGNDSDKSVSHFFHYFYCFDLKDSERYSSVDDNNKKFFSGETLVVPAHSGEVVINDVTTNINIIEDKYIPSFYYFKTNKVMYIMVNSEVPEAGVQKWFGLCSSNKKYVNIYTGIETISNGKYDKNTCNFTPLYETMYAWMKDNNDMSNDNKKKVVVAMHEMPFTVITKASLDNAKSAQLKCTRNHPTNGSRVGSNTNQLNIDENRGIYWCSRLLEYFGCKLVIGGHKHTYALSYPIKERYTWVNKNETETPVHYSNTKLNNGKYDIKPMYSTLADEAGENPDYNISWNIGLSTETEEGTANRTEFNISTVVTAVPNDATLNTTKTPYIPESMYNEYGKLTYSSQNSGIFRCCTPINVEDSNYDGFINYSMCQATGYKLKSNKELPSQLQVFSKIIPMTTHAPSGDSPSGEQLYPMYSVLEFNNDCSEVDVKMMRIQNIFKANGKDKFDQLNYGTKKMVNQSLCTYEKEDCDKTANSPEEANTILNQDTTKADTTLFRTDEGKIYKCIVTNSVKSWKELSERMYGKWLDKAVANTRLNNYLNDPTNVSDNRYLHIKF